VALRLAKAGYAGGDPEKVMQMQVGWVMATVQFEKFCADYERKYIELNREKT
jgi:hypothetical protein